MKLLLKKFIPRSLLDIIEAVRAENYQKNLLENNRLKASNLVSSGQNNGINLEIGAGAKKGKDNWVTLDLNTECDLYWDLMLPLPFPENSLEMIYSSHVLEHFYYRDLTRLLDDCYKVLKKNGRFSACVPDASIYVEGYTNPKEFIVEDYCKYTPAFSYNSEIDYLNYIAYMDGNHRYMFDSKNLVVILEKTGFKNVRLRQFDPLLDKPERDYESLYVEAEK